ncbi:hypothetical protein AWL63_22065 [Sphingomonas panacis]|uniref:Uncharacterized protein n=1 Tax=Sphingomonas panacis TaxID=1560345 RepID=A0A1B3ZFN5_9SPHN|nr:hypothetical protein [Sphingomonas panacis]AOH86246.1 hypothetical protein AWL63_22065 [Sphingomonas panacis]
MFVYRVIATGTIEEKILALQERKAALAEALWSEDAAAPAHLTADDIAFLLGWKTARENSAPRRPRIVSHQVV